MPDIDEAEGAEGPDGVVSRRDLMRRRWDEAVAEAGEEELVVFAHGVDHGGGLRHGHGEGFFAEDVLA